MLLSFYLQKKFVMRKYRRSDYTPVNFATNTQEKTVADLF